MTVIKIDQVSKSFADVHAVCDLSFAIDEGTIFGLLGPNGAGKTTTIRMIMQIILPDKGNIEVFNQTNSTQMLDRIGYLPEERGFYKKMKTIDTITFFAELKGIPKKESLQQAENWLERFELAQWRDKKVEELSRGMQQKLQFICTIIHQPELIILDEPFAGLDPVNTNLLKEVMLELKKQGTTIIFSTHLMDQVEKLCESICLIDKGQNVLSGSLSEIKKKYSDNRIRLRYQGNAEALFNDSSLIAEYDDDGKYVEIRPVKDVTPNQILAKALQHVNILGFEMAEPSLNEIFIHVVEGKAGPRKIRNTNFAT